LCLKLFNESLKRPVFWFGIQQLLTALASYLSYFLIVLCKVDVSKVVFELTSTRKAFTNAKITLAGGEFSVCVMLQKILAQSGSRHVHLSTFSGKTAATDASDGGAGACTHQPGSVIFKSNLSLSSFSAILFIREE
jgi:hypothetical protein